MPRPKDYKELKSFYDFQRKKDYHRKFINTLTDDWEFQEKLYDFVIDTMIDDYEVPKNYFVDDELPQIQPPQTVWAWNCLNYKVQSVRRPFIFIRRKDHVV